MNRLVPLVLLLSAACGESAEAPLFTRLDPAATGVAFENAIEEGPGLNVLEYEYFYNGGGVAAGDVDGDGLPDLYFTANMRPNALYLNRGGFRFEDVTEAAGVAGRPGWTTGVTMADVNGDGRLDLYVCRSGRVSEERRRNELFINEGTGPDGVPRFREAAAAFGLDSPAYSTHATFFDYDRDGDLDLYLLNHNVERFTHFDVAWMKAQRDEYAGDRLYRNDPGPDGQPRFVDVSQEAGIIGNPIGFGLSATAADFDGDGWTDLYVGNDYDEDDYFYRNNGDGTFTESLRERFDHTSYFSMGADAADVTGDGRLDLVTLDMLPLDNRRQKLLKGPDNYDAYQLMRGFGYHHQHMRNMLHVAEPGGTFQEVGQLAGISNTDWSWSALLADFDLDGWTDLYVTNGYVRDYTNMDFLKFTVPEANTAAQRRGETLDLFSLVEQMPSTALPNVAFRNAGGGLHFERVSAAWGLGAAALSGGAAWADLDADGDLDLAVNNINAPALVYRNEAVERGARSLRVQLDGDGANPFGVGARVEAQTTDGRRLVQELMPTRGYQSSVEPVLVFGLGESEGADVRVTWPDGRAQAAPGATAGTTLVLRQAEASEAGVPAFVGAEVPRRPLFVPLPEAAGVGFTHEENSFIDFKREPLLPHMLSRLGPALAVGDANGDGLDDAFVGGAAGQAGALFLQQPDGTFRAADAGAFAADAAFEDVDALFFDADADGDRDLYVVSGGAAEAEGAAYQDRLYRNVGFGRYERDAGALPAITSSGGTVAAHDWDADGDLDLFVGGRVRPGRYPEAPRSYLLENEGGRFADVTATVGADLAHAGMVSDALWADLDGDGGAELVIAGEWMPIRVFRPEGGRLAEATEAMGLAGTGGWWNALDAADLDGDGDLDLVGGNRGLNAQMQASPAEPATITAADLDSNGTIDPVIGYYIGGRSYPAPSRDELLDQVNALKKRFTTYASYADATLDDLFPPERLGDAPRLEAHRFETTVFENVGGTFRPRALPREAQVAPVNAIRTGDVDGDGVPDLVLAGNNFAVRAQQGRYDAGRGLVLLGRGDLTFEPLSPDESGFRVPGDVRRMAAVRTPYGPLFLVAPNGAAVEAFRLGPGSSGAAVAVVP